MIVDAALKAAAEIAHESGRLLLHYFGAANIGEQNKGDRDLVTEADLASEQLIVERLSATFPEDGVVAEEGSMAPSHSGRTWYVDPLDGTLNFARGLPIWCVSLSLFQDDRPILGVVHDPIRHETFTAGRALGAHCNGSQISCSGVVSLDRALTHLTIDFHHASLRAGLRDLQLIAPQVLRTRNVGSAALALAYLAAGRLDAMLHRFAHAWDYGAGAVLVQEAGGAVTDISGERYGSQTQAILAACSIGVHDGLLDVLREHEQPQVE